MIIIACFVAPAQRIAIPLLNFNLLRIMVVFGWVRIVLRNETRGFVWKPLDSLFVVYITSSVLINTLQRGTFPDLMNRLGYAYDACGMYFLFRCLIRDWCDLDHTFTGFAVISVPVALAFLVENCTGRNAFAFFGGVPELTVVRDGRLRCQGAFSHPILAGCFWASVLPLISVGWWATAGRRTLAVIGTLASLVIVVCCASSTPVGGVLNGILAALLFPFRRQMRTLRWGALAVVVALHLMMQAPVWHLLARVQLVGGSTAWQRYLVVNEAIRHCGEWWLFGLASTAHWDVIDITNEYVLDGLRGGGLTLILLIAVIAAGFGAVGRLWRSVESSRCELVFAWALGVSLYVHCVNFVGVSYFGQIIMVWYLLLACVASLSPIGRCTAREPTRRAGAAGAVRQTPVIEVVGSAASVRRALQSPSSCDA